MAEKKKYNSILVSGRKDETLTYTKYIKDEESGESVKESLDKKVNVTDKLETQQIKDGAITNEKMAAGSVGNTNLQDGSVSNEKLEDGSITNKKLAENSITKDKLKDNTIGVEKLDPELRQTINAATGLPKDLVETIQNVDDTLKDHQRQLDDKQSQIDDKQQQITANDEDISLLQTRSTQMEEAIKGISVSGGASIATAVTYENTKSGLDSVTAQGAIDELASKKFNKENISQEFGDSKDKVVSQFALPFREIESPEFVKAIVDAEDHFLFGIQLDGSIEWGKGIPAPIRTKLQEIAEQILKIDLSAKEYLKCNLEHHKISILGDSLSTYQGYNPTGNLVYYPNENNDVDSVEKTWWKKVIMDSNSVLSINESYSGSKISGTDNSSFVNRIKNLGEPQYLIIHGGTNDLWQNVPAGVLHFDSIESELNTEEFADAYDGLIRKVVLLYPTTNILLIIPHCVTEPYAEIIKEIADHYKLFGVVDLRKYKFSTANGHYQTSDMEIVANAVLANLFVNKNILKEKGKSLTEDEINDSFKIISNEEFVKAIVDSEDRILFGIYRATGKPYFPKNELYHLVKNDEYLIAWVDKEDRIVMGIKEDGYLYMRNKDLENTIEKLNSVCIDVSVLKDITSRFSKQNDDNLLWAETDSEDKVIGYTAMDGSHYFRNLKSETIPDEFYHIKNQEGISEAKTDSEDRLMSFRDKDGYLNEMVGIKTKSLLLSEKGFNDFKKALADSGFDNSFANWSSYLSNDGEKPLNLPTPKCAVINISTNVEISSLLKMGMEGAKNGVNYNVPAEIEFWDMNGNFFKKPILLSGQGRSSMSQEKKNMSIDIFDSSQYDSKGNLGKGEAFSIKFGDWVAQDGFHLKAYYTDFFRGINNAAYKFWYEIEKTRGFLKDATWKKGLLNDSILNKNINNLSVQIDNGARCVPDGFPSVVYINGGFYGLYSLNLKKHRDNYNMDKNNSNHVHLDGIVDGSTMWYNLDWTAFEVRNPKFLVYKTAQYDKENGKYTYEYNADIAQAEIAGLSDKETSSVYSSSVSYSKGSLVTVGNKLFMSLSENNIGNNPSLASYGSKPKDVYKKATEHWIEVTHTNNAKQAVLKLSKAILNIRNSSNQKEEFEKETTIVGSAKITFYAKSSAKDTDFVVRLTEVDSKGRSMRLCDGFIREKFREGVDKISLLEPGKIYKYEIVTTKIANTFLKGTKLRLQVMSGVKNYIFPNQNTGNNIFEDTEFINAEQTIISSKEYPSFVELYTF